MFVVNAHVFYALLVFVDQRFLLDTDAAILLWKLNDSKEPEQAPAFQEDEDAQLNKESWSVVKTLRYIILKNFN